MATKTSKDEKTLIIVESPTKAKTIRKYLPDNYVVIACNGHVRDLPQKELAIDIEHGYEPQYVIAVGKERIIKSLKNELAGSTNLLLATDEDREGESISWHLLQLLKPRVPYRRMVFHEITKQAITYALSHGRDLDMALVNAQEARRVLDRLYGYTISPFLWEKLSQRTLSAGRVQSPGLRLIVERERQRLRFVSASYWDIKATLHRLADDNSQSFEAKIESVGGKRVVTAKDFDPETGKIIGRKNVVLLDQEAAEKLAHRLKEFPWIVESVQEKEKKLRPAVPFITSTLQQEGSRKLHLSAKETMKIAQNLYESGLITYMRTDSPALSEEGTKAARDAVRSLFGADYLSQTPRQFSAKSSLAQEAHEAIRPAGDVFVHPHESGLHGKAYDLYELIWKRALASQMADAIQAATTVRIKVDDALFVATGKRIVFPGFIRVYVEGKDDPESALEDAERLLPALQEGEQLACDNVESVPHETKPPARYTEATLVQELEKLGIGRPSTYATIIDKLFERSYVVKEASALVPTFIGFAVVQLLEDNFMRLVDYGFTSAMEASLDGIAEGKVDRVDFLKSFYEGEEGLKHLVAEKSTKIRNEDAKRIVLPQISQRFPIMIGKFGPYVIQKNGNGQKDRSASIPTTLYPGTISDEIIEQLLTAKEQGPQEAQPIGRDPQTGLPVYLFTGRFGPYFQLGLKSDDNPNPKRVSVPKGREGEKMEIEEILNYFSLPRTLGVHPDSGEPIIVNIGRYGPYIGCGGEYRSLSSEQELFSITYEEAIEKLAAPKAKKRTVAGSESSKPILSFGEYEGKPLGVYQGRYGYYGKLGTDNFSLPSQMRHDVAALQLLTRQQIIELSHAAKPPRKKRARKASL